MGLAFSGVALQLQRTTSVQNTFTGHEGCTAVQQMVKFKGAAGRAVFNAMFARSKSRTNDLFLPGRTAFVFDLEDAHTPDIPTTLRRSKADCPEVLHFHCLLQLNKPLSYFR